MRDKVSSPEGATQMAQSFISNHIHIVFSTKARQPLLTHQIRPKVWAYLAGIAKNIGGDFIEIGGTADHVHILLSLPSELSIAKAVNLLKSNSSKWLNQYGRRFAWQEGYAAFSVSTSNREAVRQYVRQQEKHHKRRDFAREFRVLLKKHRVEFDEKYFLG